MTNRREFLQIGLTAGAWPAFGGAVATRATDAGLPQPDAEPVRLSLAVYDTRFPESVAFGERCARLGVPARPIEADMTRLWYHEIHQRWQQEPAAIAGLTAFGPLFCFEELARAVRMRVVFRAEHRPDGRGGMGHQVRGPVPMLSGALHACSGGRLGAAMADMVSRCPAGRREIASAQLGTGTAPDEDTLYTWVIAPATRA